MSETAIGSIALQLNRKAIKNLHISVLPPDGRVRVSAPETMTDNAIRMAVIKRMPWIKKQQRDFTEQIRQSQREMVSGECHYLWGKRYRLNVVERAGKHEINVQQNRINLTVNRSTSIHNREKVLTDYYRAELKSRIPSLLHFWMDKMGVEVSNWGVKQMKTKWGSCNIEHKRIWFNLELAKKPHECLEYILVHELTHLLERNHNTRFKAYMDEFLPDWKERRDLLNKSPLGHYGWAY